MLSKLLVDMCTSLIDICFKTFNPSKFLKIDVSINYYTITTGRNLSTESKSRRNKSYDNLKFVKYHYVC